MTFKGLAKVFISGFYENLERIILGTDSYTSKEMTAEILRGIELPKAVFNDLCIGCSGCKNACPTGAITMKSVKPVKITENYSKEYVPKIDYEKCVYCFYCHDFCPVFSLFNEVSPIHPRHVGEEFIKVDLTKLLEKPVEIPDEQLRKIAKILSINMSGIVNREKKASTKI
ncbi:4Fe-4S ferredoxin iron-sulfur binding domain protein [Methanococcus vannielii SB]|jgi:energy-converting hydrogenase B subunit L|uniref:4Fe-4S ferredoxin iron-sulfur binding domain protein n=1 Tax=Methanococcus vannielii (strain ATCC 35089 / DSM 1224 / JCM 13029 / OCM 148 / SB) TaxID=406327 RepID=A6UQR4_METVS|nr:4Fe-4S binding protein [Methanococcus vannielii]ABR54836.1 4Fe-4S ferredoxin iron-sulfur binding domain protein [Methanococcus vannielii SB]